MLCVLATNNTKISRCSCSSLYHVVLLLLSDLASQPMILNAPELARDHVLGGVRSNSRPMEVAGTLSWGLLGPGHLQGHRHKSIRVRIGL